MSDKTLHRKEDGSRALCPAATRLADHGLLVTRLRVAARLVPGLFAMLLWVGTSVHAQPLPEPDAAYHGTVQLEELVGSVAIEVRRDGDVLASADADANGGAFAVRIPLELPVDPSDARTAGHARVGDEIKFFADDVELERRSIALRGEIVHMILDGVTALCGRPVSGGPGPPVASDALFVLRVSVDLLTCTPTCMCDTNASGSITAGDALAILRSSVGVEGQLGCEDCPQ